MELGPRKSHTYVSSREKRTLMSWPPSDSRAVRRIRGLPRHGLAGTGGIICAIPSLSLFRLLHVRPYLPDRSPGPRLRSGVGGPVWAHGAASTKGAADREDVACSEDIAGVQDAVST